MAGHRAAWSMVVVALLYYATPNVQAAEVPLDLRRRGHRDRDLGARVGGVRASTSRTSPATTRPTARWPASSWRCCGCGSRTSPCCSAPRSTPSWSEAASSRPGIPAEEELQLPARDTRNIEKAATRRSRRTSSSAARSASRRSAERRDELRRLTDDSQGGDRHEEDDDARRRQDRLRARRPGRPGALRADPGAATKVKDNPPVQANASRPPSWPRRRPRSSRTR